MTGQDFHIGSYIVFGSRPMALAEIRQSSDIDMLVTPDLYDILSRTGWKKIIQSPGNEPLTYGDFEAHQNWDFSSYNPTLEHLLSTATVVDDVPFASLQEVKKWKQSSGRPKDIADIKLINGSCKVNNIINIIYLPKRSDPPPIFHTQA